MIIKEKTERGYVLENEYGKTFTLTAQEARDLQFLLKLEDIKDDIHNTVDDLDGDIISIGSLDVERKEFEQEVFDRLDLDEYCATMTIDDSDIENAIIDIADEYGIRIDD